MRIVVINRERFVSTINRAIFTESIVDQALQNFHLLATFLARLFYSFNVSEFVRWRSQKFVCLTNARRAVHAILVGWIILKFRLAELAGGRFPGIAPISVGLSLLGVTMIAIYAIRPRIVEILVTSATRSIRQRLAVNLRMVLAHPPKRVQYFPAFRHHRDWRVFLYYLTVVRARPLSTEKLSRVTRAAPSTATDRAGRP